MARNIEKLTKIEHPKEISEIKSDTIEPFPTIPKLDLVNIEPYTEPGITIHVDLDLYQLEEPEE